MEFEWDENKRQINLEKHGIDFLDAREIWDGPTVEYPRKTRGQEPRITTVGESAGRVIAVIWTPREERIRLISARRARRYERKDYSDKTGRASG